MKNSSKFYKIEKINAVKWNNLKDICQLKKKLYNKNLINFNKNLLNNMKFCKMKLKN